MAKESEPQQTSAEDVAEWLRDVLDEQARVVEVRAPLSEVPLRSQRFPGGANGTVDEAGIKAIAERILRVCQADARTHGAPLVMYTLVALRAEGEDTPHGTIASRRVAVAGRRMAAGEAQPAALETMSNANMMAVHIKHVENLGRLMLSRLEQADTHSLELIAIYKSELASAREDKHKVETQLAASFTQRLETYRQLEELTSLSVERQMSARRIQLEEEKQKWMTDQLSLLLPLAANRLLGGGPGKGGPLVGEGITALLGSLKPEQIEGIIQSANLEPTQAAALAELYATAGAAYQKRVEGQKRRTEAALSPAPAAEESNGAPTRGPAS